MQGRAMVVYILPMAQKFKVAVNCMQLAIIQLKQITV